MADVFVSYKREDRSLARQLVRTLQERGFTVWWDSRIETVKTGWPVSSALLIVPDVSLSFGHLNLSVRPGAYDQPDAPTDTLRGTLRDTLRP